MRLITSPDVVCVLTVVAAFVIDGVSATGFTATVKVCVAVCVPDPPSATVTSTIALPLAFACGVYVSDPVAAGFV